MFALQVQFERFDIVSLTTRLSEGTCFVSTQGELERFDDFLCDFVLDGEDVLKLAFVTVRP